MIEALNRDCFCVSLDKEALRRALEVDPAAQGLHGMIEERCPHLFATLPLFVSRTLTVTSTLVMPERKTQKRPKPAQASTTLIVTSTFSASKNQK